MTGKITSAVAVLAFSFGQAVLAAAPKDPAVQQMQNEVQQIKAEMQRQASKIDKMDLERLTKLVYEVNAENKRLLGIIQALEKETNSKVASLKAGVQALESDQRYEDIKDNIKRHKEKLEQAEQERAQAAQERANAAKERKSLKGRIDSVVNQLKNLLAGFVTPN